MENDNQKIKFIYADLQRTKANDEIYLDTFGTENDLKKQGVALIEGEKYLFWRDDEENDPLIFTGVAYCEKETNKWYAKIDSTSIKHLSESDFSIIYTAREIQGV